jgi:hypothetical protein
MHRWGLGFQQVSERAAGHGADLVQVIQPHRDRLVTRSADTLLSDGSNPASSSSTVK